MGLKKKIGKARKDKFYHLAKETGYRARSAFKLIQLNRKFSFLEKSQVCLDLCAAPGGWSQVAANQMPVSSSIIAIDLVSIKPIARVKTLVDDITTDKCRVDIKRLLGENKADVVLNDGAPNVGQSWVQDAFTQAGLTLHAMKLASEFLRKGGWFITKVFRSQDYHALIWVFKQLFNKVHATKPQASRNESAEIFVVCQGFKAPGKLDPKFLDPKAVFSQVEEDTQDSTNPFKNLTSKKKKALGYADGDYTLHSKLPVSEFFEKPTFMELLAGANELIFDDESILHHTTTTEEIRECCKDIKLLGKSDIKALLKWRKEILAERKRNEPAVEKEPEEEEEVKDEDEQLEELITKVRAAEEHEAKVKRRKAVKEKSKLRQKMNLKIIHKGDDLAEDAGQDLFRINRLKTKDDLERVAEVYDSDLEWENSEAESDDSDNKATRFRTYNPSEPREDLMSDKEEEESDDEFNDMDRIPNDLSEGSDLEEVPEGEANPLLAELESKQEKISRQAELWLQKDVFDDVVNEDEDEDFDMDEMITEYKKKGGKVKGQDSDADEPAVAAAPPVITTTNDGVKVNGATSVKVNGATSVTLTKDHDTSSGFDSDTDTDTNADSSDSDYGDFKDKKKYKDGKVLAANAENAEMEVVPTAPIPKLDAFGLALGAKMIQSKKAKRDIMDQSYSRYAYHDDDLPTWFASDERRHIFRRLPVTRADVDEYRQKMKEIDARPIKKVAEAKGRKKRRLVKKMEKARKKAEALDTNAEGDPTSEKEKWQQIKSIYKKATMHKKPEVKYIVARKGATNRPSGKGRYKVVDARQKKDKRKQDSKFGKGGKTKKNSGKGAKGQKGKKSGKAGKGRK